MMKLYLVRHGETTFNAEGRVQGHEDPPLTKMGIRQARAVARRLETEHLDSVYSSDLRRASSTAQLVAETHGLEVQTTPLLREANLGVFQGLTASEIAGQFPEELRQWRTDPASIRPPNGETIEQVIGRCRSFLDGLSPASGEESSLLVVGHGGSLRGLTVAALGLPDSTYHKLRFSNAGLTIISLGDRAELKLLNDTCHLDSLTDADEEAESQA